MADIDIVPKRRSATWIWIVLLIIVVATLVWAMNRGDNPARTRVTIPDGAQSAMETHSAFVG